VSSPVAFDEAGASTRTVMEYPGLGAAMLASLCSCKSAAVRALFGRGGHVLDAVAARSCDAVVLPFA